MPTSVLSPNHRVSDQRTMGRRAAVLSGWVACFCLAALTCLSGCSLTAEQAIRKAATVASWGPGTVIDVKDIRPSTTAATLSSLFAGQPEPSPRTELLLRKYSVLEQYKNDPDAVIDWLYELTSQSPVMSEIHALAELAEQQGTWSLQRRQRGRAMRMFSLALRHSYGFLFDPKLEAERNAYDPHFRSICDIYNRSLESMLRIVCQERTLVPGQAMVISDEELNIEFEVRIEGRWQNEQFEHFELVGDFQTRGFENEYRTYGLGVPLIAVRKQQTADQPVEKYYPPDLTLAMTAFCHFQAADVSDATGASGKRHRAILTLYDPLENPTIKAHSKTVPLQSDTTTPLAYHLSDPLLKTGVLATASLLNAETTARIHGMYMLEPYDPNKIPVVMVHGLWSSPATWAHMFNDLRANADLHQNYQFWFYSYSTAQPFWTTARQMRNDLTRIRKELDPQGNSVSLDQMVLVGHSMGGLISKMQTVQSGNRFWQEVSQQSIDSLQGDPESIRELRETFFFNPMPSVKRVVTIATPFGGSEFANVAARWFSHRFFTLPSIQTNHFDDLIQQNKGSFNDPDLLTARTSIDSLSSKSTMIHQLRTAPVSPNVRFHNIVGRIPKKSVWGKAIEGDSDGVVLVESAFCEHCHSAVYVADEHSKVHQHAACIYEVQRILLANLGELNRIQTRTIPQIPLARDTRIDTHEPGIERQPQARVAEHVGLSVEQEASSRRR